MDDLIARLARFERRSFPRFRDEYRRLVAEGQHPRALFLGCSDSRVVPYLLTGAGPGDLFIVRNVGSLVPAYDPAANDASVGAALEFAVGSLGVRDIIVCGHSHCGAIRALYAEPGALAGNPQLARWLEHGRDAVLPVTPSEEALRRTEQRSVALGLDRLMGYPAVAAAVERGAVYLHGWHYLIEEGRILVLDVASGAFVPTDVAMGETGSDDAASYQLQ